MLTITVNKPLAWGLDEEPVENVLMPSEGSIIVFAFLNAAKYLFFYLSLSYSLIISEGMYTLIAFMIDSCEWVASLWGIWGRLIPFGKLLLFIGFNEFWGNWCKEYFVPRDSPSIIFFSFSAIFSFSRCSLSRLWERGTS